MGGGHGPLKYVSGIDCAQKEKHDVKI